MTSLRIIVLLSLALILLGAGCRTGSKGVSINPLKWVGGGTEMTEDEEPKDPVEKASVYMTRVAVGCMVLGLIFAALTSFRTGWGISLTGAGVLILLLAWAFDQPWVPWLGLSTIVAYLGYKIYNWKSTKQETEHFLM